MNHKVGDLVMCYDVLGQIIGISGSDYHVRWLDNNTTNWYDDYSIMSMKNYLRDFMSQ